jgi:hypothetical protein
MKVFSEVLRGDDCIGDARSACGGGAGGSGCSGAGQVAGRHKVTCGCAIWKLLFDPVSIEVDVGLQIASADIFVAKDQARRAVACTDVALVARRFRLAASATATCGASAPFTTSFVPPLLPTAGSATCIGAEARRDSSSVARYSMMVSLKALKSVHTATPVWCWTRWAAMTAPSGCSAGNRLSAFLMAGRDQSSTRLCSMI